MKNLSLIIICLFPFINSYAQVPPSQFKLGLSAVFDTNLSADKIENSQYIGYSTDYNKINYRIGLNLEYILKKDFSILTAIQYSNKDFTGTYYCAVCSFVELPEPEEIEFRLIEVPLYLRYYFSPDKIRVFGETGINNQFIVSDFIENNYALALKFGAGLEYELNSSIALQILIDYNKGVMKIFEKSDYKLDYLGFGVGIIKKL